MRIKRTPHLKCLVWVLACSSCFTNGSFPFWGSNQRGNPASQPQIKEPTQAPGAFSAFHVGEPLSGEGPEGLPALQVQVIKAQALENWGWGTVVTSLGDSDGDRASLW